MAKLTGHVNVTTTLTPTEAEALENRLKELGVTRYQYLKTLILKDIEKSQSKRGPS